MGGRGGTGATGTGWCRCRLFVILSNAFSNPQAFCNLRAVIVNYWVMSPDIHKKTSGGIPGHWKKCFGVCTMCRPTGNLRCLGNQGYGKCTPRPYILSTHFTGVILSLPQGFDRYSRNGFWPYNTKEDSMNIWPSLCTSGRLLSITIGGVYCRPPREVLGHVWGFIF